MEKERIAKNTLATLISRVISIFIGTAKVFVIVRFISVTQYGTWTFANLFSAMFLMFADMGMNQIITRDITADYTKTGKYLGTSFIFRTALSILIILLIIAVSKISSFPKETVIAIAAVSLSLGISSVTGVFSSVFQAYQNLQLIAILSIVNDLLSLIIISMTLFLGFSLNGILVASLVLSFINFIVYLIFSKRIINNYSWELDISLFVDLIKEGYPLMIAAFIISAYKSINPIMLKYIHGDKVLAIFNAPFTIITYLSFFPYAITQAIFPVMSRLHHLQDKNLVNKLMEKSIFYLNIISIPMALGTIFLSSKITMFIFSNKYNNSSSILQILIIAIPFSFINWTIYSLFTSIKKQKVIMYIYTVVLILNIILGILLIPNYSIYATGGIIVFTELCFFIVGIYFLNKYGFHPNLITHSVKPLFSSVCMSIFLIVFNNINILINIPLASVFYFIILIKINTFSNDDKRLLINIINSFLKTFAIRTNLLHQLNKKNIK